MEKHVAIFLNKDKPTYSETFITNHIDHFQAPVFDVRRFFPFTGIVHDGWSRKLFLKYMIKSLSTGVSKKTRLRKLDEALTKDNVDIILAEYGHVGAELLNYCESKRIPLVVHYHGYDAHRHRVIRSYRQHYERMGRVAKAIVVVSTAMRESLLSFGIPPEKIHLIPYGVNTDLFYNDGQIDSSNKQIVFVGRFIEKKAPDILIRAFAHVHKSEPEAHLIMIGDGPLRKKVQRLIADFSLESSISLLGARGHDEVMDYLRSARIFAMHSLTPRSGNSEGTPNAVLEASCTGIPVVSTKHAGIKDAVVHGTTGYLVDEGDVVAMAEYMLKLLSDTDLANEFGKNGKAHIAQYYEIATQLAKLEAVIMDE